jgi:fructokinase
MGTGEVQYRVGIDVGGTKIEGVVLDSANAVVYRERIDTETARGYPHIIDRIGELHTRMTQRIEAAPHTLGIGTPGALSAATGRLKNSNTTALNGQPVQQDLQRKLGRAFRLENVANCFALAEAALGAGRGIGLVFGVIMGTGCGGGIVWNGLVHEGRNRIGGEWGHTVIDPAGPACYCGARGCVETYISGSGLERRYAKQSGRTLAAAEIVSRWREGEAAAAAVMDRFFERFGQALANLINTLDPDAIVLGGGLSNIDELYARGADEVRARVFGGACDTPILRHALGDSAGVIGAARIGV